MVSSAGVIFMSDGAAAGQWRLMSFEMWYYIACHITIYDIACNIKGYIHVSH